jgi:hypothetical protein
MKSSGWFSLKNLTVQYHKSVIINGLSSHLLSSHLLALSSNTQKEVSPTNTIEILFPRALFLLFKKINGLLDSLFFIIEPFERTLRLFIRVNV